MLKNVSSKLCHIENSKKKRSNSVDPNEVAHNEPPHHDLHRLQIQLVSFLVFLVLICDLYHLQAIL